MGSFQCYDFNFQIKVKKSLGKSESHCINNYEVS